MKRRMVIGTGIAAVVVAAAGGWAAARQIESPGTAASKTAAPEASLIVVPVEKQRLSSDLVLRGSVRYGAPQAVNLPISLLKKSASLVTTAPTNGADVTEGEVIMAVSGRPVFVLQGDRPTYRDLGPGANGPDVEQLEKALARLGLDPGTVDGVYDERTAGAVTALYDRKGWQSFGPTDEQLAGQRGAQADAFLAQSELLKEQEALETARAALTSAYLRERRAAIVRDGAAAADAAVRAKGDADRSLARADVAAKAAAVDTAVDNQIVAQRRLDDGRAGLPAVPTAGDLAALEAGVRIAAWAVTTAQSDLSAAQTALAALAVLPPAVAVAEATLEVEAAAAEVAAGQNAVAAAERRVGLFAGRANGTAATPRLGVQVPADELLFFPTLPLRISDVSALAGQPINGPVMTISNARLAIDAGITAEDARLIKTGSSVSINAADLGVKAKGTVGKIAETPGTNGVDPQRFHMEVVPTDAPAALVGSSVVLNVTVGATEGEVLTVPVSALSVDAKGVSRVQLQLPDRTTKYVTLTPGLTAGGLVAVTTIDGELKPGDMVIVGVGTKTPTVGGAK